MFDTNKKLEAQKNIVNYKFRDRFCQISELKNWARQFLNIIHGIFLRSLYSDKERTWEDREVHENSSKDSKCTLESI